MSIDRIATIFSNGNVQLNHSQLRSGHLYSYELWNIDYISEIISKNGFKNISIWRRKLSRKMAKWAEYFVKSFRKLKCWSTKSLKSVLSIWFTKQCCTLETRYKHKLGILESENCVVRRIYKIHVNFAYMLWHL